MMSITWFLLTLLLLLLVALYHVMRKNFTYWRNVGIACDPPHWLMGSLAEVGKSKSFRQITLDYYEKYKNAGPFVGFYWFFKPAVFVLEPELMKHILIKDFSKFVDRGMYCNEEDDPLSGILFNLEGSKWRNMRNKLSPTFTSGKMKVMLPLVIDVGGEFINICRQTVDKDAVVDVRNLLTRFSLDVIGTCAFGLEINSLRKPNAEFLRMSRKAFVEPRYGALGSAFRFNFPHVARKLHMKETLQEVENYFMNIITETVNHRERFNIRRNDFMDMLIDLKNNKLMKGEGGEELTNLTFGQIAAQAFVFLLAGFETSATTMSFALYELAQHPEYQQKAREEVLQVLERHNQEFTYECLKELVYLEQVIQETLRLYTVIPLLNRIALEDYVVPQHPGYVIKKGMPVLIPACAIHRDERYYPQPNIFNPNNFNLDIVAVRDPILNLAFGDGPRNCIGMRFAKMQTVVGLSLLLKNFQFSVCEKTDTPMKLDVKSFLVCPESGIYLKVENV